LLKLKFCRALGYRDTVGDATRTRELERHISLCEREIVR
jgi:hypothetical protein